VKFKIEEVRVSELSDPLVPDHKC